jgi:hypothetical protein
VFLWWVESWRCWAEVRSYCWAESKGEYFDRHQGLSRQRGWWGDLAVVLVFLRRFWRSGPCIFVNNFNLNYQVTTNIFALINTSRHGCNLRLSYSYSGSLCGGAVTS